MVTAKEIQEKIASYVAHGIDLDAFEDWIAQSTWNIHQSEDIGAARLAHAVELRLSEHSSGHLPEPKLRQELSSLLVTPMIQFSQALVGESRSSNQPVREPVLQPWQRVDKADGVVFV